MEKHFVPRDIERKWYQAWEQAGIFAETYQPDGEPFCLMLPPPNVTGHLHMGHAFQHTLMDIVCRYQRMRGRRVLWQPGTDHAGIATQMVVTRQLAKQGKTPHDIGRDAFVDAVWQWKQTSGGRIGEQMRRLGVSVDWARERFTMDDGLSQAVNTLFVQLYRDGLIYRGQRIVNWDPLLQTAISDLEVENVPARGQMYYVRYPFVGAEGGIVIATTRPETMFGDVAVAVHPDDSRYAAYVGKQVEVPLIGRPVPVIADAYVDRDSGSGCLKVTPAHDKNDYHIGCRHQLPLLVAMTPQATLNEQAPPTLQGLDRFVARDRVVAMLREAGFLVDVKPHEYTLPYGDRSHVVIEPYLTDQWFVRTEALAARANAVVSDGDIRFVPDNWRTVYHRWMDNIEDWCISRQLWWGHRIPAWFADDGRFWVAHHVDEARAAARQDGYDGALRQDNDVLDTWFSSALWPFSTLGWPDDTETLRRYYPTDVLITGFDIIFFWVARMVMMGLYCTDTPPFHTVYVTGLVLDEHGQKMSKSKGNVIDPLDVIDGIDCEVLVQKRTMDMLQPQKKQAVEKMTRRLFADGIAAHGVDALRFSFASQASFTREIRFSIDRVGGYRHFVNKIWNAARYVLHATDGIDLTTSEYYLHTVDRWIIGALQSVEAEVVVHIDTYRFDLAADVLYEFIWHQYCDWYLEFTKPVLRQADAAARCGTGRTLLLVLEAWLRLLHPFMPFVTEEIWQQVAPRCHKSEVNGVRLPSILCSAYPVADKNRIDAQADIDVTWLQAIIGAIRQLRSELAIAPNVYVPVTLSSLTPDDITGRVTAYGDILKTVGRCSDIHIVTDTVDGVAAVLVGTTKVSVAAPVVDTQTEATRLDKHIARLREECAAHERKLADERFINRAPVAVVATQRQRLAEAQAALQEYCEQRQALPTADA